MKKHYTMGLGAVLILGGLLASATAGEPASGREASSETSKMVIIGDDGEEMTLELCGGQLTLVSTGDGHTSTRVVDLEALGLLAADAVDGAMVEVEDVFRQLQEMQFQFRLGQDNRLNVSYADTEFELDLDQVMAQVASAVQLGLQELDTADWTDRRPRHELVSDDELRSELASLKVEMEKLRRELRRLHEEKEGH